MKRSIVILIGFLIVGLGAALFYFAVGINSHSRSPSGELVVLGTADKDIFAPVINDFNALYPDITIQYQVFDSQPLYDRIMRSEESGDSAADLVLSSAMDLQVTLVNAGLTARHVSASSKSVPAWTRWRNEAFSVTYEPAVMVFNNELMQGREIPTTRQELLRAIRSDPEFWSNKVGTYDISRSSAGYLLASQDARRSSEFSLLLDAFGEARAQISDNTSTLLDEIETGNLAMGYNLLGSYARARVDSGAPITIIYPQDYTLAISRTAVILKSAPNHEAAHFFLEYLLSYRGQQVLSERSFMNVVHPDVEGPLSSLLISDESQLGILRPVALGPGLLVYLDPMKQKALLQTWRESMKIKEQ